MQPGTKPLVSNSCDLEMPIKTATRPNALVVVAWVSVYNGGPSAAPVNMLNLGDTF